MPLPGLNEEEARHAFLKSFNRNQTTTTSTHKLMPHFNFESISERRRHLFLDVAFLYIPRKQYRLFKGDSIYLIEEPLLVWLSALYRGQMDKCAIKADLKQLAYDGLLEFEDLKEVRVHDLYTELAAREAAASGRFVGDGIGMNYAEATRLHCQRGINYTVPNFEELQFATLELSIDKKESQPLATLELLIDKKESQWLQADMRHLRMLEIGLQMDCNSDCNLVEWGKMTELTWLRLHIYRRWSGFYRQMHEDISQLRHLVFLSIEHTGFQIEGDSNYRPCLNSLVNLQYLNVEGVYSVL